MNTINFEQRLQELKIEKKRRDFLGWDDYEWSTHRGDFVDGQISLLEEMLGIEE